MTAAKFGGEELDFRLTFGEDSQPSALGHADNGDSCYSYMARQEQANSQQHSELHYVTQPSHSQSSLPSGYSAQSSNAMDSPSRVFDCPSIQITSIPATFHHDQSAHQVDVEPALEGASGSFTARDQLYLPFEGYRDTSGLSRSPCSSLSSRSWLSDASSCESFSHVYDDVDPELNEATARCRFGSPLVSPMGSPLPSPLTSPQASPQVSPLVSPTGSPSCVFAEDSWMRYHQQKLRHYSHSLSPHHSPYQSPRTSVTEDTWLGSRPRSSSISKPSSRPTSPYGKRPHSDSVTGLTSPHISPSPSPSHSPRGSVTDETWLGSPTMAGSFQACAAEVDIPSKTRRTYPTNHSQPGYGESGQEECGLVFATLDSNFSNIEVPTIKKEEIVEHFLSVPTPFTWGKPKQAHTPLYRSTSLPRLDSPLPSQHGLYELKLEVQPKPHHRAHYETEGSRGAIKSAGGGHPVVKLIGYSEKPVTVQMFIGTADDSHVKPHAFYQVHRITGKTVATPSQELVISSTKILEIPLLPENNMSASIDCAGILKLRNSDIELRKGETDIGRKNTRVRAVFRVHIPQGNGKVLSLQAASIPIECSQRSAQELPQIDSFNPNSGSVNGGQELEITGPNITPDSKVIFLEKGPDGKTQWEVDAQTIREKSRDSTIIVKIPSYHKRMLRSPTQVQFYVSNGKRKRSVTQRFTYVPAVQIKQEFDGVGDVASFRTAESSDHLNPLEQWLHSAGPVCVPSSNQLSYSPLGAAYFDRYHPPPSSSFNAVTGPHHIMYPASTVPSFQGLEPNLSYNGQLSHPNVSLQGSKLASAGSDNATSSLGAGYASNVICSINQISTHDNESYHHPTSVSTQPDYNHLHPVMFSKSSPLVEAQASGMVPLNREVQMEPKSPATSCFQATLTSEPSASLGSESQSHNMEEQRVNIKEEPAREKEVTFQSIGLQDITLDDVSEIIVRDLFHGPESTKDPHSLK